MRFKFADGFWDQFKDKKTVLYGAGWAGRALLYWAEKAGIDVAYFVDRDLQKHKMQIAGKDVKAPIELMYEDYEKIKIVIAGFAGKDSMIKTLTEMGFSCDKQIVITDFPEKYMGYDSNHVDALLGASRGDKTLYNMKEDYSDDDIVIITVGGSTTDPLMGGCDSWPFYLQEMIDNNKISARVVNIARSGYTSSQELLVLLREGIDIRPDIVVSYSGYNDCAAEVEKGIMYAYTGQNLYLAFKKLLENYNGEKPFGDVYYGKIESDRFERYITNMRIMHAMCGEFNCKFYGVLQPTLLSIPVELLQSPFAKAVSDESYTTSLRESWHDFYNKYSESSSAYDYLYDFTHILNGHDDVFIDLCHVTEDGNRIIAENVFKLLMEQKAFEKK